jgi:hypothetical protein
MYFQMKTKILLYIRRTLVFSGRSVQQNVKSTGLKRPPCVTPVDS